jgi:hypothetical protein
MIQRLDGYTDGRESWLQVKVPFNRYSRDAAEDVARQLQQERPNSKFRVRMKSKLR